MSCIYCNDENCGIGFHDLCDKAKAACSPQQAACSPQQAACSPQQAACSPQQAATACNLQQIKVETIKRVTFNYNNIKVSDIIKQFDGVVRYITHNEATVDLTVEQYKRFINSL